jgi:uncharacterized membrane protein
MPEGLIFLLAAVVALVGCHLLFSHALRGQMIRALGDGGFHTMFSVTSVALLLLTLIAYHKAPHGPAMWSADNLALQVVFSVGGYFAAALLVASLVGNPALIGANIADLSTRIPSGVYKVTRHPMMFAIAIWSVVQFLIDSSARNLIFFGGFAILALVGSRLQDIKKIAQSGREWKMWSSRTPFWPDLRHLGQLGLAWPVGILPWMLVTGIEVHTALVPVGLWYFFPNLPS